MERNVFWDANKICPQLKQVNRSFQGSSKAIEWKWNITNLTDTSLRYEFIFGDKLYLNYVLYGEFHFCHVFNQCFPDTGRGASTICLCHYILQVRQIFSSFLRGITHNISHMMKYIFSRELLITFCENECMGRQPNVQQQMNAVTT